MRDKVRHNNTSRIGINAIERIVIHDLKWIFREQPIEDFGIDAHIEIVKDGNPTRFLIASQIKTGAGNFSNKEKVLTYYASEIHKNYWLNGNIPAILIAHLPETDSTYWVSLEEENFTQTNKEWKVDIPKKQKFGAMSERRLLELVNLAEPIEKREWNEEYIELLKNRIAGLLTASEVLLEYTELTNLLKNYAEDTTSTYTQLAESGLGLKSKEARFISKLFATRVRNTIPRIEACISKFSLSVADSIRAIEDFLIGCIDNDIEYYPLFDLKQFYDFRKSSNYVIQTTSDLRNTMDCFIKEDVEVKKATVQYSQVLSTFIVEFEVARDMNEKVIALLEGKK